METTSAEQRQALAGRRILVGITGGIAAYKAAELVRLIVKSGGDPHVVMTQSATRFITPLTLETLSGNPVATEIFSLDGAGRITHTELTRDMDAAVIAPATADFIGRLAGGLADQLLLCALMASRLPVLLCPSMNVEMWNNPLVQRNVQILRGIDRYRWVEPGSGWLACNVVGTGRLPDPPVILKHLVKTVMPQDLAGKRLVITAGATREWLDPVRFLSNPSTGRMGNALAEAAWERGADVTLLSGSGAVPPPDGVHSRTFGTTEDLLTQLRTAVVGAHALIMAAAPADWRPTETHDQKQKKQPGDQSLALSRTPDILASLDTAGALKVGFAAETQDLVANATAKVQRKGLDLIFANPVGGGSDTGFGATTNAGTLLDASGGVVASFDEPLSKAALAHQILNHVAERL